MDDVRLQFSQDDRDMLRDVSGDVKRILLGQAAHGVSDDLRFAAHDERLTKLERWRTSVIAAGAAIGFLAGIAFKLVTKY